MGLTCGPVVKVIGESVELLGSTRKYNLVPLNLSTDVEEVEKY